MRTLIVEDDFISRHVLQEILLPFSMCDAAVNGREALEAFLLALDNGTPYDLICLDIMMPEIDGKETLKRIRAIEKDRGIVNLSGVKIIMTTALEDFDTIKAVFRDQCEAYLVKPITQQKLLKQIEELKLIPKDKFFFQK
jgi:two-component system, chemotaxis family, chemotaxis protein CheY